MKSTLYEWARGAAAFDRLTDAFYRRVRADPILEPVSSNFPRIIPTTSPFGSARSSAGPRPTQTSAVATSTCSRSIAVWP